MRNPNRRLTLDELVRVTAISEALFAADTATLRVRFNYTKDGETTPSVREGYANGVFGAENKMSLYLTPEPAVEAGKSFNVRNITDLTVIL